MRARKRFGQHFLHGRRPAEDRPFISPGATDHVVEIGPGRGAPTHVPPEEWTGLTESSATLDLIEIDRDLAPVLRDEFAGSPRVTGSRGRALDFDFAGLANDRGGHLRIIGNLPYNISTPLLFHLLDSAAVIDDMHVMLQREVVDRIAASPGQRATTAASP